MMKLHKFQLKSRNVNDEYSRGPGKADDSGRARPFSSACVEYAVRPSPSPPPSRSF